MIVSFLFWTCIGAIVPKLCMEVKAQVLKTSACLNQVKHNVLCADSQNDFHMPMIVTAQLQSIYSALAM